MNLHKVQVLDYVIVKILPYPKHVSVHCYVVPATCYAFFFPCVCAFLEQIGSLHGQCFLA